MGLLNTIRQALDRHTGVRAGTVLEDIEVEKEVDRASDEPSNQSSDSAEELVATPEEPDKVHPVVTAGWDILKNAPFAGDEESVDDLATGESGAATGGALGDNNTFIGGANGNGNSTQSTGYDESEAPQGLEGSGASGDAAGGIGWGYSGGEGNDVVLGSEGESQPAGDQVIDFSSGFDTPEAEASRVGGKMHLEDVSLGDEESDDLAAREEGTQESPGTMTVTGDYSLDSGDLYLNLEAEPGLTAGDDAGNEAASIGGLKTIASAQTDYNSHRDAGADNEDAASPSDFADSGTPPEGDAPNYFNGRLLTAEDLRDEQAQQGTRAPEPEDSDEVVTESPEPQQSGLSGFLTLEANGTAVMHEGESENVLPDAIAKDEDAAGGADDTIPDTYSVSLNYAKSGDEPDFLTDGEAEDATMSGNNLKQMGLAAHSYSDVHKVMPPDDEEPSTLVSTESTGEMVGMGDAEPEAVDAAEIDSDVEGIDEI
jgi:hypothetical protein